MGEEEIINHPKMRSVCMRMEEMAMARGCYSSNIRVKQQLVGVEISCEKADVLLWSLFFSASLYKSAKDSIQKFSHLLKIIFPPLCARSLSRFMFFRLLENFVNSASSPPPLDNFTANLRRKFEKFSPSFFQQLDAAAMFNYKIVKKSD